MGFILSKFRRKKSTQDILEGLEKEIKRISNNKRQSLVSQSTVVKKILIYGLLFWVLAFGCVFYLYRSAQKTEDIIIFLPILFLIPTFLFFFRRVSTWWYHSKISKDDDKLSKLKEEKSKILDEVMEKETYKVATQILEKYDPSRLPGKSAEHPGSGGRPAGGATGRPQPMVVAASPHGGRQPISTPRGGGMDLRKRPVPGQQSLNQSMSILQNRKEGPAVNMNQTIGAVGRSPLPQQPPGYPMGRGMPPGGMSRGGPPLPRPVIPRERGVMDRVVEYLVGDGPSNRYALICRQCQSHNGMALREEFEYISYRCCYCHYWNPARKQRPVAPRLPDPPPTPPTPRTQEPSRKLEGSPKLQKDGSKETEKDEKTANESEDDKENKKEEGSIDGSSTDEKEGSIDGASTDEKKGLLDGLSDDEHESSDNHDKMQVDEGSATARAEGTGASSPGDEGTGANTADGDGGIGECDVADYDIIAPQDNMGEVNEEDINEQVSDEGELDLGQPPSKSEHIQLINKDDRTMMPGSSIENNMTANRDESMEVDS